MIRVKSHRISFHNEEGIIAIISYERHAFESLNDRDSFKIISQTPLKKFAQQKVNEEKQQQTS